jgi:hypothetical protein
MEKDLKREARSALIGAAERLGVDPFRLARFLSDGRLADILTRLRVKGTGAQPDAADGVDLAERYLEFLDQEIQRRGTGSGYTWVDDSARPKGDGSIRPKV